MSESYNQAACRHFGDAEHLAGVERWDNAGHLIGFAAECALKYAIVSLRPGQDAPHKHFPELREIAKRHLSQRNHRPLHILLAQANYFDGWIVEGRYTVDAAVTSDMYRLWRTQAARTLGAAGLSLR